MHHIYGQVCIIFFFFLVISTKVCIFAGKYWQVDITNNGFSGSTSATFDGNNNDMSSYLEDIET